MRKKLSTDVEGTAAVLELEPDDELVTTTNVTTTKTIGRRKPKPAAESEPEAIATGATFEVDDDLENVIDIDGEDDDRPAFSPDSLAALLYGEDEDNIESKFCTVLVRREPDDLRDQFLIPCNKQMRLPRLGGISLAASRADIEDRVRDEHGSGGTFTFQLHVNGGLGPSWTATLADDPRKIREAQNPTFTPPPAVAASVPAIDPQAAFINSLKQAAELRGLLFGDVEAQLRDEIKRLREEREQLPPAAPKSEKLELLELAFNSSKAGVADRVVDALFPTEDDQPKRHWAAEMFSVAMEHKEEIAAIAGPILASFLGGPRPPMPPPMFQQPTQPPALEPPPILPNTPMFGRRKSEPETESEPPASAGGNTDAPKTNAEPTETDETTEAAA